MGNAHPTMAGAHWWAMPTTMAGAMPEDNAHPASGRRVGTAHQNARLNRHPMNPRLPPTAVQAVGWALPTKMPIGQRTTPPTNAQIPRLQATQKHMNLTLPERLIAMLRNPARLSNRREGILTGNR
jgi:hypothetical protein